MTSTDPAAPRPPAILLDHVTITVSHLPASQAFYDAALAPLGLARVVDYLDPEDQEEVGTEAVGYGGSADEIVLWLVVDATPTSGVHLAFRARDENVVRSFFDEACAAGAIAHTPPRPWQIYRPGRFSAMVTDPGGNLVEAVTT